ncbi:hypothetical protein ADK67_19050 [Saccharothrix sp. NRRL B-16348]|uniref:hypothetical protein n=1 Tax=Saccharothrix sp. NRRL B-16348 TaxID=1415542 RepID=UPI0006AEAA7B|nr:hypothetical protein [Saccharothrix sp. NRRL B-16348]KOX24395.1 hypothetical protein ADK67_19050 [Saccharothrix sp. NRRL B-16348]
MLMTYDDDTGNRVHLDIRPEDRPADRVAPPPPPSKTVRTLILDHADRHREWGPDRIHAHFRNTHRRHDIPLTLVRFVLTQEKARERR